MLSGLTLFKYSDCSGKLSFDNILQRTLVLFLCFVSLICIMAAAATTTDAQATALKAVSESSLKFTKSLYKILSRQEGNIFFSPLSIEVILALTYMGAEGNTALQMSSGLHLPEDREVIKRGFNALMSALKGDEKITLEIANNVYVEKAFSVKPEFVETAVKHFLAGLENVDFRMQAEKARLAINQWVEGKTNNKIKDLLAEGVITSETVMVLVNAIYFKGNWIEQFNKDHTREEDFHVTPTETKKVQMMHLKKKFRYVQSEILDCQVLELPYQGGNLGLMVFLPSKVDGLKQLEEKLHEADLNEVYSSMSTVEVQVALPKFKLEQTIDLKAVLQELGMKDMFESNADFKGITDAAVSVSKVIHKAFIEVNEEGSEAAAATAGIMCMRMMIFPPEMRADHPFVFYIVDHVNHTPLFFGRFSEPTQ